MTKMKFAHDVVVDSQKNEIRINGLAFPYWIKPDPEIEVIGDGLPAVVNIGIYADNLTYISEAGEARVIAQAADDTERRWAAERGREIVREGLAEVIIWLAECEKKRQPLKPKKWPHVTTVSGVPPESTMKSVPYPTEGFDF